MGDKEYTLDELVSRSGFGKRQIRYYITRKLVPGAGEQRGPNAVYGAETLRRLQAIALFKHRRVGPTGRAMTLAEIRHALDNMGPSDADPQDTALAAPMMAMESLDELPQEALKSSAIEFLNNSVCEIQQSDYRKGPEVFDSRQRDSRLSSLSGPALNESLDDMLRSLHSLLTELGSDTRFDARVGQGERIRQAESWQRLTSPDVEIQVRTPDSQEARRRLYRMAAQLGHLLDREE